MTIYNLIMDWYCDDGSNGLELVGSYRTIEKAKTILQKEKEQAIEDFKYLETDQEESDTYFSIWEAGEYGFNHINLKVVEAEIEN